METNLKLHSSKDQEVSPYYVVYTYFTALSMQLLPMSESTPVRGETPLLMSPIISMPFTQYLNLRGMTNTYTSHNNLVKLWLIWFVLDEFI